jgi:hypothetical protein
MTSFGFVQYGAPNVQTHAYAKCPLQFLSGVSFTPFRGPNCPFPLNTGAGVANMADRNSGVVQIIVNILKPKAFGSYVWARIRKFDMTSIPTRLHAVPNPLFFKAHE